MRLRGEDRFLLDVALLNCDSPSDSYWANLGYWENARDFYAANRALATLLGKAANLGESSRLLDVGFGAGDQLALWHDEFGVKTIYGIDITPKHFKFAAARFGDQFNLSLDSATDLKKFRVAGINRIISLDSAYHYPTRGDFFAQAWDVLEGSGRLALTDICLQREIPFRKLGHLASIPPQNLVTLETYRATLENIGFENIQIEIITPHVYSGFSRWAGRHWRRYFLSAPLGGWDKILGVALGAPLLNRLTHYILVSADKPS